MKPASIPKSQLKQKFSHLAKRALFLVGLGLASVPTFVWQQQTIKALAVEIKVAQGNSWSQASFPVEKFQAYTSPFGYRRLGSTWEFHPGLDIAAPEGSYIRNWWTGIVERVSDGGACGTYVAIQSGNWQHIYCHMEGHVETTDGHRYLIDREGGIQIWEGQQVVAGTRIGRVGMTGRTTGPHLHWGLKYDSNYIDPALVLRAMYSQQTANSQRTAVSHAQRTVTIQASRTIGDSGD
ncbi:MAG: M23 family metallopeptidase [Chroococcidiopsidaceae cyanobacterium CP_BM_ER_R8_30]|nr:M23 family metallopeptidase [Chroococcidiopsidaceae cyanobacterium CP_BM_ER_R8_30]